MKKFFGFKKTVVEHFLSLSYTVMNARCLKVNTLIPSIQAKALVGVKPNIQRLIKKIEKLLQGKKPKASLSNNFDTLLFDFFIGRRQHIL